MDSYVTTVPIGGWVDMSPADIFFMQLPRNEIQLWCKETSKNLVEKKRSPIDVDEMKKIIGCLFVITQ